MLLPKPSKSPKKSSALTYSSSLTLVLPETECQSNDHKLFDYFCLSPSVWLWFHLKYNQMHLPFYKYFY